MVVPKLTELTISGFRSLRNVRLKLDGLTVLVGDNGSGKSSILEALELLRCTAHENYPNRFASIHGGIPLLMENGAERILLTATVDDGMTDPLTYYQGWNWGATVPLEFVQRGEQNNSPYATKSSNGSTINGQNVQLNPLETLINQGPQLDKSIATIAELLRNIDIHLPFEVGAAWSSSPQSKTTPRGFGLLEPTARLNRFGTNLANAYQALKNEFGIDHWSETLEYVQLGLGDNIRDVRIEAIPGGGHIALALETRHQGRVTEFSLADGVLSYLAFVAMFRLDQHRSLLAFDEPEQHLHPGILPRVLGMFEAMSERYPVVLATHSDRLLDGLTEPTHSVVVTELDVHDRTRLRTLDEHHLSQWIEDYRGLGELRADGELLSVLQEVPAIETTDRVPTFASLVEVEAEAGALPSARPG
ncbi:MAG: AAA family ATPase [Myxococcota bacterium]